MTQQILAHLHALVGERHPLRSPSALLEAERYLSTQFRAVGLNVLSHEFQAMGQEFRNVIAVAPNAVNPDALPLIVAAHYDTVAGSPGADDNASGLAVLLEVASRLRGIYLLHPLKLIAFSLEEEDLLGSLAYAAQLAAQDRGILGAMVLECVGFASHTEGSQRVPPGTPVDAPTVGNFLGVVGNEDSAGLVDAFIRASRKQVPQLGTLPLVVPGQGEQLPDTRRSDHAAFWYYGFPAIMLTDTANFRNPNYHQPTDTIETLDLDFIDRVVDAVVAAVTEIAGVRKT